MTDITAGRVSAVMKVYPVATWFAREMLGLRILAQVPDDPQPREQALIERMVPPTPPPWFYW